MLDAAKITITIARIKGIHQFADDHLRAINGRPHLVDDAAITKNAEVYEKIIEDMEALQPGLCAGHELFVKDYPLRSPLTNALRYLGLLKTKTESLPRILEATLANVSDDNADATAPVEKLLRRTGESLHYLGTGQATRNPMIREIKGEKDFQDMLFSFLKLIFDDVRPEEYAPSDAGGNSSMDFLLKDEQIVIEAKGPRDSLTDKIGGEEMLTDITRYRTHPDCKTLFFAIYDPKKRLKNTPGLIKDIEKHSDAEMKIRVIVIN